MNFTKLLTSILLACVLYSCDESALNRTPALPDFWELHHQQLWTESAKMDHLLGSWKWTYERCCPESSQPFEFENMEGEELILQFDSGIVSIFQNGVLIQQSAWYLELRDGDLYGLVTEPYVSNTHGRILFAEDWVQFNSSYVDGSDNYFRKIE